MELDDVVEAFAELVDFIGGELPILRLPGEPELRVTHLLKAHHLAKSRDIRLRSRSWCPAGRRRRLGPTGRSEQECGRYEQEPEGTPDHIRHGSPRIG